MFHVLTTVNLLSPHLVYTRISLSISIDKYVLRVFSCLGSCKQCCDEHGSANASL